MRPSTLLCYAVAEYEPVVQSVVDSCAVCSRAVWRALSTPKADAVMCMDCGLRDVGMRRARGENVIIAEPTPEQIADAKRAMGD